MAKKVYTVSSATFNSTGITSITSMSWNTAGASPQSFFSDGDIYSQFAWLENLNPTASVTTTDLSNASTFTVGQAAALVQKMALRASGVGGKTAGSYLTATWNSSTMLGDLTPSTAQSASSSSLVMPFTGVSTDGTTSPVTISIGA